MNKFRIIYLMLCAFPIAVNAQDSIKNREILTLNSEINRLAGVNKNLRLELDSIKKVPIKLPSGFYLRLESSYPIKNPFVYNIVPSNIQGKRVYTVQSFKNSKDAKQLTKAIRAFNLMDYKVVYIGNYSQQERSSNMKIEE